MITLILAIVLATFDSGMSVDEMKKTGVVKLSAKEKLQLDSWIEKNYAKKLVAQNSKQNPVLQENLKNGSFIGLSDNSIWEIRPQDMPITQGWITPVEIKITASDDPEYPYSLTNTLTGSVVKARKSS